MPGRGARPRSSIVPLFSTWVVTRYEDVHAILRDPRRFSSSYLFRTPVDPPPEVLAMLAQIPPEVPLLVSEDPPGHTRTRALVSHAFLPKQVARMAARIRVIAHELIDQFPAAGCADLVRQYTYPLPMRVLLEFLGLPAADAEVIKHWCHDHMLLSVPGIGAAQQRRSAADRSGLQSLYRGAHRGAPAPAPGRTCCRRLIHARVHGERPLDDGRIAIRCCNSCSLRDTKRRPTCSATPSAALLRDATQWQALQRDLTFTARAVEEGLRYDAPVQGMFRTTTEEVTIRGVTLPAGARVFVVFGAANRDEHIFPEPDRFDVQRPNADKHVSFGHGVHYCIGAPLVRLEARIALEVLVQRLPDLHLVPDQPMTYLPSLLNRALQHLQVRWGASRTSRL